MKKLYLIVAALLLFAGCENPDCVSALSTAENQMWEHPDSALNQLKSINTQKLRSRCSQARYALLYSQALDKNCIDVTNDSLIRTAVEYYKKRGSDEDRLASLYYLGRIQCNAGDFTEAMLSYIQAKEYADKSKDHRLPGLLYKQIGEIYRNYYDYPNYLEAATKAYDHFGQAELHTHQHYALLDMATAYFYLSKYDLSFEFIDKAMAELKEKPDSILFQTCLGMRAMIYYFFENPEKVKKNILTIRDSLQMPMSISEYTYLAYAYACEKKTDSVSFCIAQAEQSIRNDADKIGICRIKYRAAQLDNNYKEAFTNIQKCLWVQDSVVRQTLSHSVMTAQRDFFQTKSNFTAYTLKMSRIVLFLVIAILIMTIFAIIFHVGHRLKLKDMEINKYMSTSYKIQNTLLDMNARNGEMYNLIQQLLVNKFEFIDQLGCTYYERQHTKTEQEVIFNAVKKAIDDLGSDQKTKQELEQIVNTCKDGILTKMRQQLPRIKESDFEFLCYLLAGFSYRVISIFMQEKVENIYTRKSRLKTKIAQSDAPDKEFFMNSLKECA